jgi:glycosyltransferase involved in cell wall biosynthesis
VSDVTGFASSGCGAASIRDAGRRRELCSHGRIVTQVGSSASPAEWAARAARTPSPERATPSRITVAIVAPSLEILGGQAVQAARLLEAWRDDPDVEARLVPINPRGRGLAGLAQRARYLRTVATQALYWPSLVRELRHADVVHVFSASYTSFVLAPWPAVQVAQLLGKPVLMNYRSGEAPDHLARSPLARRTLRAVDVNVVPSRFLRDVFARFAIDATVIPNVVDTGRFAFRRRAPLCPRVLSTRNLEPLYNVECTLRAFRLVQDRHPDATLALVGAGSDEPRLRQLAAELRLSGVTFAGRVPQHEVARWYAEADLYVQTPDIDNMPSSILEAWSSGLPVVSTEAGGVPAMVTNERDGLLVPLGDHQSVASAIERVLADAALAGRLVDNGRENADALTWTRLRERWLEVYRRLRARGAAVVVATT